jgi:hypothetical protein
MDWEVMEHIGEIGPDVLAPQWVIDPTEIEEKYTDPTLMATRCKVYVYIPSSTPTAPLFGMFGYGIIAWDSASGAVPFGPAVPDPLIQGHFDWIARVIFPFPPNLTGSTLISNMARQEFGEDYISKARRRIPTGTGILAVASVDTTTVRFGADTRVLIKE